MPLRNSSYATTDGLSYREIGELMTAEGDKMTTATAREHFLRGLAKLFQAISAHNGVIITFDEAKDKCRDPMVQEALQDLLQQVM
jgi:hypothetical protein|tara:strand:- start:246 stop:500 length:255 start_codon:yes stop_codon:yes gene_type:complete